MILLRHEVNDRGLRHELSDRGLPHGVLRLKVNDCGLRSNDVTASEGPERIEFYIYRRQMYMTSYHIIIKNRRYTISINRTNISF